jgi:hypothetical protein
MFSIREVPQSSTGFSTFNLLYGRKPQGLLDLPKEVWEAQPTPLHSVVEHVETMRGWMTAIWPVMREHLEKAQCAQAQVYNRGAHPREFQVGNRVLVLISTAESKLLATWHGPYEVIEKLCEWGVNDKLVRRLPHAEGGQAH